MFGMMIIESDRSALISGSQNDIHNITKVESFNTRDNPTISLLEKKTNHTDLDEELERRLSEERFGWRKFTVVVGYANPLIVPQRQTALQPGDMYVADEYVFNSKQNDNVGRMYQRCILIPNVGGLDPTTWECLWEFELQFRSAQPGKLSMQGPWFYDTNGFKDSEGLVNPLFPDKQYAVISGGTGAFVGVYGVGRIRPLDLLSIPPTLCYTFYLNLG